MSKTKKYNGFVLNIDSTCFRMDEKLINESEANKLLFDIEEFLNAKGYSFAFTYHFMNHDEFFDYCKKRADLMGFEIINNISLD